MAEVKSVAARFALPVAIGLCAGALAWLYKRRTPSVDEHSTSMLTEIFLTHCDPGKSEMTRKRFLDAFYHLTGSHMSEKEINNIFDNLDEDRSSTIDLNEFLRGVRSRDSLKHVVINDDEALHKLFYKIADGNELTFEKFKQVSLKDLHFDLSEHELRRVFDSVDTNGDGVLDKDEFVRGISRRVFLRRVVVATQKNRDYKIPADFDYDKSTNDNYRADNSDYYGVFADLRKKVDYSYHVNYSKERQQWQNDTIQSVVSRTEPQKQPWIVFTCGPMGAGKGYALSWMSRMGYFPVEHIVHIDPDYFKLRMPEWKEYLKRGADGGSLCHRESAFIQELTQEAALLKQQNIWIDGSLRDGNWFAQVFKDIRKRFPKYKIGIIYVSASEAEVRKRIKKRAEQTGRTIPEELIKQSLQSPDLSLGILTSLADFLVRVNNDQVTPRLESYEDVDRTGSWHKVQSQFETPSV